MENQLGNDSMELWYLSSYSKFSSVVNELSQLKIEIQRVLYFSMGGYQANCGSFHP